MASNKIKPAVLYCVLAILASACGGGSSTPAPVQQPVVNTTVWQDSNATTKDLVWSDGSGQDTMKWSD